jgi:hypothetical protein
MKLFRIVVALCVAISSHAVSSAEPLKLTPMPEALVSKARSYEVQVRNEFKREIGHAPKTSRELLAWLDEKSIGAKDLDDREKDELVQSYGAVLGQLLVQDLGGRWVLDPNDNSPGVDLPGGKVAFVFNRAGRRIFNGDAIGFVSFYDASASYAHGTKLPADIASKVER